MKTRGVVAALLVCFGPVGVQTATAPCVGANSRFDTPHASPCVGSNCRLPESACLFALHRPQLPRRGDRRQNVTRAQNRSGRAVFHACPMLPFTDDVSSAPASIGV